MILTAARTLSLSPLRRRMKPGVLPVGLLLLLLMVLLTGSRRKRTPRWQRSTWPACSMPTAAQQVG